jgi:hypothetical protein
LDNQILIQWSLEHGYSVRGKRGNIFWKRGDYIVWAPEEKLAEEEHQVYMGTGDLAIALDGQIDDKERASLMYRFVKAHKDELDALEYILHRGGKVFTKSNHWLQVYEGDDWVYLHDGRNSVALDCTKTFRDNLVEYLPSIKETELERVSKEYAYAQAGIKKQADDPFGEPEGVSVLARPTAAIVLEALLAGGHFKDKQGYEWAMSENFEMCVVAHDQNGNEHYLKVDTDISAFIVMCNRLSEAEVFLILGNKVLNDIRRDNGDR